MDQSTIPALLQAIPLPSVLIGRGERILGANDRAMWWRKRREVLRKTSPRASGLPGPVPGRARGGTGSASRGVVMGEC